MAFLPRLFAATSLAALLVAPAVAATAPAPQVTIESGRISGSTAGTVASFKGIPFAKPPVEDLRWRAPQRVEAWKDVRAATEFGHDCMQEPFPSDAAPLGATPAEDCLTANVWTPATALGKGGGKVSGKVSGKSGLLGDR